MAGFASTNSFTFSSSTLSTSTASSNTWTANIRQKEVSMIGLDFETYSATDLTKHGLMRYVQDPSFKVLLASVATSPHHSFTLDFVTDPVGSTRALRDALQDSWVVAHNAIFEKVVLFHLGITVPTNRFVDSAVVARAAGATGSLASAAPQLLGIEKLDGERALIKLFSMPQPDAVSPGFDSSLTGKFSAEWAQFIQYCERDAMLSLQLYLNWGSLLTNQEKQFNHITMDMNLTGWPVDVGTVERMQRRYLDNMEQAQQDFLLRHDAATLNLNSLKQLKEWCHDRGVKASSFDEKHVASLLKRLADKLLRPELLTTEQLSNYSAVVDLLELKQTLGGSSLKKLQVILDTEVNGRLYDQYLHCGAGQTLRTTGRSVQMQNLKRLHEPADMVELLTPVGDSWDNTKLAENLRQVFTASDPQGYLVVGDFSSIESRGLAWLANEGWKLQAYKDKKDLYKAQAAVIYGVPYAQVSKDQRQTGKVGELSCGYGAGPEAVQKFAQNMHVDMSEAEAAKLVFDWRDANPNVVSFWTTLDTELKRTLTLTGQGTVSLASGYAVHFAPLATPDSLLELDPKAQSITMQVLQPGGQIYLTRVFHGCHMRGRNVCYYKPSALKNGALWVSTFVDPKTKHRRSYDLYGGKLAGILTQSLCREIFFRKAVDIASWCDQVDNVELIGQFHDEFVLDWRPSATKNAVSREETVDRLTTLMTDRILPGFPIGAEVKFDYRYTK